MINDNKLIFSKNQDVHATDTTVNSTNTLNMEVANPNQGAGSPRKTVRVKIGSTPATGGTSIKAGLYHSPDNSTYTLLAEGPVTSVATAIKGKTLLETILPEKHFQYLRVTYTLVGAVTAVTADAFINIDN